MGLSLPGSTRGCARAGRALLRGTYEPRDQRRRLLLHGGDGVGAGVARDRDGGMLDPGAAGMSVPRQPQAS